MPVHPAHAWFRWFAWRPVITEDRGLRWLRLVWRRRVIDTAPDGLTYSWFEHTVRKDSDSQ